MKKILILSNHFITLYNFRRELIRTLIEENNEVFISMPKSDENKFFSDMGCKIIETDIDRRGINPLKDLKLIADYIKIIKKVKPNIILSYTIKPNIYGCIASRITKNKQISNITGTGGTFLRKNIVSEIVKALYKVSIKKSYKVFFQNKGDKDFFVTNKMVTENYSILPGSGVNLQEYKFSELPNKDEVNFIFVGRIMSIKGIDEYLEVAKQIKKVYENVNFYVAGFIEDNKYENIIKEYDSKNIITYIGFQKNIIPWIKKCHCTVLPSHGGEGVPNVLLESASIGRICIASNISGSVDVIDNGKTGYIFEAKNKNDLKNKIEMIINLPYENKKKMALEARKKVENEFDRSIIIDTYLDEIGKI